jgi:hypothetical protein
MSFLTIGLAFLLTVGPLWFVPLDLMSVAFNLVLDGLTLNPGFKLAIATAIERGGFKQVSGC